MYICKYSVDLHSGSVLEIHHNSTHAHTHTNTHTHIHTHTYMYTCLHNMHTYAQREQNNRAYMYANSQNTPTHVHRHTRAQNTTYRRHMQGQRQGPQGPRPELTVSHHGFGHDLMQVI